MAGKGARKSRVIKDKGKRVVCYDISSDEEKRCVKSRKKPCTELTLGGCRAKYSAVWKKYKRMERFGSQITCQICLSAAYGDGDHHLCCTPCGHMFGHCCIKKWLLTNPTCPECRSLCYTFDLIFLHGSQITESPAKAAGFGSCGETCCAACFPKGVVI